MWGTVLGVRWAQIGDMVQWGPQRYWHALANETPSPFALVASWQLVSGMAISTNCEAGACAETLPRLRTKRNSETKGCENDLVWDGPE